MKPPVFVATFMALTLAAAWLPPVSAAPAHRLFGPKLHTGQAFFYRIEFHSTRDATAESSVTSPLLPPAARLDFSGLLQVQISEATTAGFRLKTYLSERQSVSPGSTQPASSPGGADKPVEFFLTPSGSASQFKGFDRLSAAQQAAWSEWLARFTSPMTFPSTPHVGQKWQSTELEATPTPIAGLSWTKKFQYARDEPCSIDSSPSASGQKSTVATADSCAVVLITATLRQGSPSKNSTPSDYRLQNLKTQGTASGQNETILYISRSQALLARSTESAQQSMDVTIFLADGANQVHYTLDAKSRSEIVLVSDWAQ
jgi:hypothetical protein